jgi:peptidyl-tRNA hydrolase, PTH2 family
MRKGKIAAQAAHASMKVFFDRATIGANRMIIDINEDMSLWAQDGFKKVVLSVEDEETMLCAYAYAQAADLPCALITDRGHTEFHFVPTNTCIAIGPADADLIDLITGPTGKIPTKLA